MGIKSVESEEYRSLMKVAEVRRELREISLKWERSKTPAFVTQNDVDELNEYAAKLNGVAEEFESRFKVYEVAKLQREADDRVESFKINANAADQLNQIFQELKKPDGSLELGYDYEDDYGKCLNSLNDILSAPRLVEHMKEFIRLAESK